MNNSYRLVSYFLFVVFSLVNIAGAQTVAVLGELQSTGKVFINSSNGIWTPAMPTYPLLQGTGIRTEDGSTSIFFRDGSRVDLSRDTVVSIAGGAPNHTIHLAKGIIAFSIKPISSLSVSTPSATISVNSREGIVQMVGHEKSFPVLGVISSNEKGTEVRSISGRISIASSTGGTRTLVTGESMLVGPDSSYKVYKTQAELVDPGAGWTFTNGVWVFTGVAVGEGIVIYGLNSTLTETHNNGLASPSGF